MSGKTAAEETAVSPKSPISFFAAGSDSVLRKSSSMASVSSTALIPALAQPSSDLRNPAARDVVWWMERVILVVADEAVETTLANGAASGARSTVRRDSMELIYRRRCISGRQQDCLPY